MMRDRPIPGWTKYSMDGIRHPKPSRSLNGFTIAYAMWVMGAFLVVFGVLVLGGMQ